MKYFYFQQGRFSTSSATTYLTRTTPPLALHRTQRQSSRWQTERRTHNAFVEFPLFHFVRCFWDSLLLLLKRAHFSKYNSIGGKLNSTTNITSKNGRIPQR